MHPNNPAAHDPVWTSVWCTDAQRNTVHTHTHTRTLAAALKIRTNQCLMIQILGVREEGSGRIERERVAERKRERGGVIKPGRGWW